MFQMDDIECTNYTQYSRRIHFLELNSSSFEQMDLIQHSFLSNNNHFFDEEILIFLDDIIEKNKKYSIQELDIIMKNRKFESFYKEVGNIHLKVTSRYMNNGLFFTTYYFNKNGTRLCILMDKKDNKYQVLKYCFY